MSAPAAPVSVSRRSYRTLVLNADYRPLSIWPLSVVPAEDAISTLWRERADVVEAWPEAYFHSPSVTIAVPKIMALRQYAPVASRPKFCRRSVLLRDEFRCQYCSHEFQAPDLTFDHVVPRAAGGQTVWDNIVMACVECNARKRNRTDIKPIKAPRQPTTSELLRAGLRFLEPQLRMDFGSWVYWNGELQT